MSTTIDRFALALLLACCVVPAATAQRSAAPPAGEPAQTAPARGGDRKPERAEPATPPGRGNPANRGAVVGEMKDAEVRHRERLALIERLRALATAKGQAERLAALDKLQAKEDEGYQRRLDKQRGTLGDDEFRKVEERLSKGREKVRGKGKPADRPNAPDAKPKSPERPNADQPRDKDKDKAGEKDPAKPRDAQGGAQGQGQSQGQSKDRGGKPKLEGRS